MMIAACSGGSSAHAGSSSSPTVTSTPPASASSAATSAASLQRVLAADGIATVTDATTTRPIVPVTGPVRMRFTAAQVAAMSVQARDGGGIAGSALDAASPTGSGDPSLSDLLAAWASHPTTPASREVLAIMGGADWRRADQVLFPTIALPLFTADVIAALPPSTASSGGTGAAPTTTQSAAHRVGPGAPEVQPAILTAGTFSSPCSVASDFVQGVLDRVVSALQLTAPTGSGVGAAVGGFLVTVWNGALTLARGAAAAVISVLTAPVLNAIRTVAASAAVVAMIAGNLNPWSVKVTPDPSSVDSGGAGKFTATVDPGTGGSDYPAYVSDCASGLGITLPPLTAADAKATWVLGGSISATGDTAVTLDSAGSADITFTASSGAASGGSCTSGGSGTTGTARITVTRPGLDTLRQLATTVLTNGFGVAGAVIGPLVQSILSPIMDTALNQVANIAGVTGTGEVQVRPPSGSTCVSTTEPASTTTVPDAGFGACTLGTWVETGEQISGGAPLGGVGAVLTIFADGHLSETYSGVVISHSVWNGSQTATYTVEQLTPTSGTVTSHATHIAISIRHADGTTASLPNPGTPIVASWTCSGSMLTSTETVEGSTLTVTYPRRH
jgi:hypothetical protein